MLPHIAPNQSLKLALQPLALRLYKCGGMNIQKALTIVIRNLKTQSGVPECCNAA